MTKSILIITGILTLLLAYHTWTESRWEGVACQIDGSVLEYNQKTGEYR